MFSLAGLEFHESYVQHLIIQSRRNNTKPTKLINKSNRIPNLFYFDVGFVIKT